MAPFRSPYFSRATHCIDEKFFVVLVILFEKSEKAMTAKGLKSGGRMIRFR